MCSLRSCVVCTFTILGFFASNAEAHVSRVEIVSRTDVQDSKPFGLAGAYEKIIARVYFAVDPLNSRNRQIVDLDKAVNSNLFSNCVSTYSSWFKRSLCAKQVLNSTAIQLREP